MGSALNSLFGGGGGPSSSGLNALQNRALEEQNLQQGQLNALAPQQAQFGQMLANQAQGRVDSPELRAMTERALKNQMSMTRANRSVNPGLAGRNAAMAGSDLGTAMGQQLGTDQNKFANYLQGQQAYNSNLLGGAQNAAKDAYAANLAKQQSSDAMTGNLLNAGAMGAAMYFSDKNLKKNIKEVGYVASDENQKTDIKPVDAPTKQSFLQAITASGSPSKVPTFDFTNAAAPHGSQIFKQDLFDQVTGPQQNTATSGLANAIRALMAGKPGAAAPAPNASTGVFDDARVQSDENEKENIASAKDGGANDSPKSFMDVLKAYSYEYKNPSSPGQSPGRHVSVMAQDLEKAGDVGKSMVIDTPNGKMVNYSKGLPMMLASLVQQNERLNKIEKKGE